MPIVELSPSETRAVDAELWADYLSQLSLDDRARILSREDLATLRAAFAARATERKSLVLTEAVEGRLLPSGERARLPEVYCWVRDPGRRPDGTHDPTRDQLLIAWGDDALEDMGGGRVRIRLPYEPLPRALDEEELSRLLRYRSAGERYPRARRLLS